MISHNFLRTALGALAATVVLTGCQAFNAAEVSMQVDAAEARVTMDRFVERPGPLRAPDTVQTVDGIWLGGSSVRVAKGDPLPRSTEMVTLISAEPLGMQDIATEITTLTGIPVIVDFDAGLGGGLAPLPTVAPDAPPSLETAAGGFAPAADPFAGGGNFVAPSSDTIQLSYSGPLGGLLDLLSTRFNVSWEYRNSAIRFYEMESRVFTLYALSALMDTSSTVGTEAEGDGDTGGFSLSSGVDASFSIAVDMFNEVAQQVADIVGGGGSLAVSPSSGTISVNARPHVLEKVQRFIDEQNERLSRQIALHVQVLSVELDQNDGFEFDPTFFLTNALDFSIASPLAEGLTGEEGAISAIVLDPIAGGSENLDNIAGSTLQARALAREEKATVVNSTNLVTINGIPVPFQQVNQTRFIAEVTEERETTDVGVNVTTTTEVEDLVTGFSIAMTPRIIADGGVLLNYSINISDLVSLVQQNLGESGSFVQIPSVDVTSFLQQAILRSGQTLALAGFEQAGNNTVEVGQGVPENVALGGSKLGEVTRSITLVLITPKIVNSKDLLRGNLL